MKPTTGNPFSLDFGREPYEMIPRLLLTDDLVRSFTAEYPSTHVSIITGVRGCGKTVFMTSICKRFQQEKDWVVVELNPDRDLLQNLAARLSEEKSLTEIFKSAKINLSAFGLGLQIEGTEPVRDIEVALDRMLESLKKHHKRVLIAIDEVSTTHDMKVFASAFQILLRRDLPIFLLMTGLYENIRTLQDQKTLTFLYRAPRTALTPLNIGRMADSYAGSSIWIWKPQPKWPERRRVIPLRFRCSVISHGCIVMILRGFMPNTDSIWTNMSMKKSGRSYQALTGKCFMRLRKRPMVASIQSVNCWI